LYSELGTAASGTVRSIRAVDFPQDFQVQADWNNLS
jgi:hypothetical protein